MTLRQVADVVGVPAQPGWESVVVTSVEFDTRRVRPGALYVALRGERVDGHDLGDAAAAAGAVAVLGSGPVHRSDAAGMPVLDVSGLPAGEPDTGVHATAGDPAAVVATSGDATGDATEIGNTAVLHALARLARASVTTLVDRHGLQVIGVTGSSGKTSTKDLLAAVLRTTLQTQLPDGTDPEVAVVAPSGSFNNELGHPYTALRATADTRFLVLELSARGVGHIAALTAIAPPRIGVVLNVGSAHLGEFGSVDAIARAKGELVEALPAAAPGSTGPDAGGVAVLNVDDHRVAAMADRTRAEVVLVGTRPEAQVRAEQLRQDTTARSTFELITPEGSASVRLQLVGEHHVGNALAVAAVARALGMEVDAVAAALSQATPASRWRMEVTEVALPATGPAAVRGGTVTVVNDAYNANPHSMRAALRALATLGAGRRTWAVLGEMGELGDESVAAHDELGRQVVRLGIDRLLVVGDAPETRILGATSPVGPGAGHVRGRPSPTRALHLGAHLEGSWAGESALVPDVDAAVAILLEELEPGDVLLVKASRSVGLEQVALRVVDELSRGLSDASRTADGVRP
nr:UDP-N-acetylmuramoyl-tripeptide--D-alanyl-D-alanine ligase [Nakamurella leprariae]